MTSSASSSRRDSAPTAVVLLDNRDSFTFNLRQAFAELGHPATVLDGPTTHPDAVLALEPTLVCVGPGPRGPDDLAFALEKVRALDGRCAIFGVCLGLQLLVTARGGKVGRAIEPRHGKQSAVTHLGEGLFRDLPSPLTVMRYHSLVALELPDTLVADAWDEAGQVMAVRDDERRSYAVQFHPESIGTEGGLDLIRNALRLAGLEVGPARYREGGIPPPRPRGGSAA